MIKPNYITAYLRRHWPHCSTWSKTTVFSWVQWFLNHDRALLITDKNRLIGVALFRMVDDLAECDTNYQDSNGHIAYIEVTAASKPDAMKACFNLLCRKVGNQATHVAWVRGKYGNRPSVYTMSQAARHLTYRTSNA